MRETTTPQRSPNLQTEAGYARLIGGLGSGKASKKWGLPSDLRSPKCFVSKKMNCENRWLYPFFVLHKLPVLNWRFPILPPARYSGVD